VCRLFRQGIPDVHDPAIQVTSIRNNSRIGFAPRNSAPDILKDEPGGYNGFKALYRNVNAQPQISPGGPVKDLDGNTITDSNGNLGFPGFDPSPSQTLGYLATMLEAGVPVVYGYIEDAHDNRGPQISGVSTSTEETFGPAKPVSLLS
jgi:hypothetical protein